MLDVVDIWDNQDSFNTLLSLEESSLLVENCLQYDHLPASAFDNLH